MHIVRYQYRDLVVKIICALQVTQSDAVSSFQNYTISPSGQQITVTGPYVLDTDHHNWAEIHPGNTLTIL